MTSPRLKDVSLYELALSSEEPPHPLQISPTTFKSMVSTVLDLLIEQKISATLILKMPKGEIWQAEIDRYRRSTNVLQFLYILQSFREDLSQKTESDPLAAMSEMDAENFGELDLVDDQGVVLPPASNYTHIVNLPLAAESSLKREYFLLVLSEEFCGMVLAHRPRSIRPPKTESVTAQEIASVRTSLVVEEELERKHPLLGFCTVEPQTMQRVFDGIIQAVRFGLSETHPNPETETLLAQWETLKPDVATNPLQSQLISTLLTKQIQRQEEVWHSSALYRKQAEAASILRMENEELLNSIRIKDEFLKNVGQELRTPLATMKTALSLLNSPSLKLAQRQRYMEMLSQECDRQSALITSVLDLIQLESTAEQTPMQPLRLIDVVPGVVSTYQPLAQEKGVMLAYTVPEDLPAVACQSNALRQIVINLLHNGIKFTPKGGQVWVRAKQQGDYIQLEFRDTGIGMESAEIPRIFERFYRIRSTGGDEISGAGLGLSIVQQLLLRYSGSISVKSKPNEGSTFNVLLPIYR
jgi:signal transduction histidine kinase